MNTRTIRHRRHGLTRRDIVVVIGLSIGLAWILFGVVLVEFSQEAHRTSCKGNLKAIGIGMGIYATSNAGIWPVPPHLAATADEVGRVRYAPGMIGKHRGPTTRPEDEVATDQDTEMSTTRCLWTLVRIGAASPKSFMCPVSQDRPNDEDDPQNYNDFRKYSEVSYGYQVPFGRYGRASANADQDMVLVADKGPYGAALEAGRPMSALPSWADLERSDPKHPPYEPRRFAAFNSPNHGGEGQSVLWGGGHAAFWRIPLAGVSKDNIYTSWAVPKGQTWNDLVASQWQGTPPTGIETPWSETDSLIYP